MKKKIEIEKKKRKRIKRKSVPCIIWYDNKFETHIVAPDFKIPITPDDRKFVICIYIL